MVAGPVLKSDDSRLRSHRSWTQAERSSPPSLSMARAASRPASPSVVAMVRGSMACARAACGSVSMICAASITATAAMLHALRATVPSRTVPNRGLLVQCIVADAPNLVGFGGADRHPPYGEASVLLRGRDSHVKLP